MLIKAIFQALKLIQIPPLIGGFEDATTRALCCWG